MKITIEAEVKEIAALVEKLEERREINITQCDGMDIEKINKELGKLVTGAQRGCC
jgi:hypothetical protein